MTLHSHTMLIANRGEVAIRIARACADIGIRTVAIYPADDKASLHVARADHAIEIAGRGPAAYLDIDAVLAAAKASGCTAVHPGYGFLSESSVFAQACANAGLIFVGPSPDVLRSFGDKAIARQMAIDAGIPVCQGTAAVDADGARAFFESLQKKAGAGAGMLIKAVSGGGGRGMRVVMQAEEIVSAHQRASAEALQAFGCGDVYCEELITQARHIEVQILGDGAGNVVNFGERECSLQRRHQKLVEIAPSPSLSEPLRARLIDAAQTLARGVLYRGLCTFEFLVDGSAEERFVFIEANPRLQVEHTVTEEVHGVDLVHAQIRICLGEPLESLELARHAGVQPMGFAIQLRVNMETMQPDGSVVPTAGRVSTYEMPSGPGVRVDGFGYAGYVTNPSYDSLLAKIIVHSTSASFVDAIKKAQRVLREARIKGVETNLPFLAAVLAHTDVARNDVSTRWLDGHAPELATAAREHAASVLQASEGDTVDHSSQQTRTKAPDGAVVVASPMHGSVVQLDVKVGDSVHAGMQVAVLEAMKMQHVVTAGESGIVLEVVAELGSLAMQGDALVYLEAADVAAAEQAEVADDDLDHIRPDLADVLSLQAATLDAARPESVERRREWNSRTARENIDDLVDAGSFVEYGQLAVAAQRGQHSVEKLRKISPADGVVTGLGTVNGQVFGKEAAQTVVLAYDYTVMAGTQGLFNHHKLDRMFMLAADIERPVVLYAEGAGGRPGDVDMHATTVAALDVPTFKAIAHLSGLVPLIGVVHGRCYAGNAALLGCCDVIISTQGTSIGMGGPVMVEGGGLGSFTADEIGPSSVQTANGVIDILVQDERDATATAKQYLAYFQGALPTWTMADQRELRRLIPENRKRVYDICGVIRTLCDADSVLELRPSFGRSIVTALARIEGRPVGLMANNPMHLGGAIDADAADKAARFMQLCDAHGLPIVSLCDTPGFMVGPDAEKTAQVRRVSRMMVNGSTLSVPFVLVVLRKAYGLGAMAMSGGNFQETTLTVAWPTGEFGAMGIEGAARTGFKRQLDAIADPKAKQAQFEAIVAMMYAHGKATNVASLLEIDNVIDPADTRRWITTGLLAASRDTSRRTGRKRSHIEPW